MAAQNKNIGNITKKCSTCGKTKALSRFNPDPRYRLGVKGQCKDCLNIKALARYYLRHEELKERQRFYRRQNPERERKQEREYRRKNPQIATYNRAAYLRNKTKCMARGKVNWAVATGKIPKATLLFCSDCGNKAKWYDHYLGYEKKNWLSVQPVCIPCSFKRSAERGEIKVVAPL